MAVVNSGWGNTVPAIVMVQGLGELDLLSLNAHIPVLVL